MLGAAVHTISLNSFIKICLLDTGGRISEIQRRLSGSGGYDFYRTLQRAIRAYSGGDHAGAHDALAGAASDAERIHNQRGFENFQRRFGDIRTLSPFNYPRAVDFPTAGLSLQIDPLFEFFRSGVRYVACAWATQKPEMTQRYGAVACHLMRLAYAGHPIGNSSFLFADLAAGRTFSERQITNNTNLILQSDVIAIGALLDRL